MNYELIVFHMQRNDPNGEYDAAECEQNTWAYLDVLQAWYYNLKAAGEKIPAWLVIAINWLGTTVD